MSDSRMIFGCPVSNMCDIREAELVEVGKMNPYKLIRSLGVEDEVRKQIAYVISRSGDGSPSCHIRPPMVDLDYLNVNGTSRLRWLKDESIGPAGGYRYPIVGRSEHLHYLLFLQEPTGELQEYVQSVDGVVFSK